MAINKKLIHFNEKSEFEKRLANGEILDTSIVFIKDSKEIWTHSNYYASTPILRSSGTSSVLQEVEVSSFVDENPDAPTSGQDIPTVASGNYSVVLNGKSNASAKRSLAHGNRTIAQGENSHTEGHCTQTVNIDDVTNGYAAHAEGYGSMAGGTYSHAEGNRTKTAAPNSHAEGYLSITTPEAESSHAEGYETSAEAPASHTEGNNTKTHKAYSHAEGRQTETFGEASHTEGNETFTEGDYAHAEGWMTRAKGAYSHAEGQYTFTYADAAHSEGNNTHAYAPFSHAEGLGTKTNPDIIGQHVEGYYNADSDGVKVIGCGTGDDARVNAVEVKQDGRVFVKGLGNFNGTNSNEAADLAHVVDSKANSNDVYNKTELDNILTANGKIFKAIQGETEYNQIVAAIEDGFYVVCIDKNDSTDPNAEHIYYHYKTTYEDDAHTNIDTICFYRPIEGGWEELYCRQTWLGGKFYPTFWTTKTFYCENVDENKVYEITPESISNIAAYPTAEAVYNALTAKADKTEFTELSEEVNEVAEKIDNINPTPMISVTYTELVNLRDNGELISGMQYRITDYVTITAQENTRSAGHQFDVIVTADDVNVLNENARAIQHEGDTYFANSDLNAWELKYCLDNDTERFAWAIKTDCTIHVPVSDYAREVLESGLPSTRPMPDTLIFEWWDSPRNGPDGYGLDFYKATNVQLPVDDSLLIAFPCGTIPQNGVEFNETILNSYGGEVPGNCFYINAQPTEAVIGTLPTVISQNMGKGVIYRMIDEHGNDCPYDFKNIQFKHPNDSTTYPDYYYTYSTVISGTVTDHSFIQEYCHNNTMKEYISSHKQHLNNNVFLNTSNTNTCQYNFFGAGCYNNSFGNDCYSNSFGAGCYSNSFGNECYNNSFRNDCYNNSFGNDCYSNSFGNECYNNSFRNYCSSNSSGNSCSNNSFRDYCHINSFGNSCYGNSFGNSYYGNSFGNYCSNNSFRLSASTTETLLNYCQYNHFDDGCSYNVVWNNTQPTTSNKLQNINVVRGVSGTYSAYNFINIVDKNANHEIKVAKNSKGEIKIYCEADLIA